MARRILLVGAPGVGKGTYATKLCAWLGLPHLSTGDVARAQVAAGSAIGERCQLFMKKGELLPDTLINPLLDKLLEKHTEHGFLLDGYPRHIHQIAHLESITRIDAVLHIKLRRELLLRKITSRRVCSSCSRIYNMAHIEENNVLMPAIMPVVAGICDTCGSKLIQRDDDNYNIVLNRLDLHDKNAQPLLDVFASRKLLYEFELFSGVKETWPRMQNFFVEHNLCQRESLNSRTTPS